MGRLGRRDDGRVGREREVDPREAAVSSGVSPALVTWSEKGRNARNQVGLELVEVDVERSIKAEGRRDARDDLGDDPVEVLEARRGDSEVLAADVVDGLVVDHEGAVDVLERRVGREDRVVGLDDRVADRKSVV